MSRIGVGLLLATLGCSNTTALVAPDCADAQPTILAFALAPEDGPAPAASRSALASASASTAPLIARPINAEINQANNLIGAVVGLFEKGLKGQGPITHTAAEHLWVIDTKQGITLRFTMTKLPTGHFKWQGEAKKSADPDTAYVPVLRGSLLRDKSIAGPGQGTGQIGIDLDAYATVAQGTTAATLGQGKLLMSFLHGIAGTHHRVLLRDYTFDPGKRAADTFYFDVAHHFATKDQPARVWIRGGGHADLNALLGANVDPSLREQFHGRVRRLAGKGGWASAVAFGGNLAEGSALFLRECSGATGEVTYRRVWNCNYQGNKIDAGPIVFASCQRSADANQLGGTPGTDTTDNPLDASNQGAAQALCSVDEAGAELSAETYVTAGVPSLSSGSTGVSLEAPNANTNGSALPTPYNMIIIGHNGCPGGTTCICTPYPACLNPPCTDPFACWTKA